MPNKGFVTIEDISAETSRFEPNLADDTPANQLAALNTLISEAFNDGLITGLPIRSGVSFAEATGIAGTVGANAHRELKWLITYEDTSQFLDPPTNSVPNPYFGRRFSAELPTANPGILPAGSDILPLTAPEAADFVTEFEATAKSPTGGDTAVREIRLVGRAI